MFVVCLFTFFFLWRWWELVTVLGPQTHRVISASPVGGEGQSSRWGVVRYNTESLTWRIVVAYLALNTSFVDVDEE